KTVTRWLIREYMGAVILAAVLFLAAGRTDWFMGWALVAITFAWVSANALILIPRNPALLAERMGPKRGAKRWDTVLMSIIGVAILARLIIAGLDVRYGWSAEIIPPLQVAALVVAALAYALVVWATAANAFFSQIVRIQHERGHSVATGGPYRFVRHPGYVGTVLFELSVPVMLGSWWALAVGVPIALLFVLRTALEDRTLRQELAGYQDFARQVRYRLIPAVW
ncbi:MAG: isoprenylcysteine carboxylmethyltransferase family protein, partial [Candidatus Neomarinimicrobiota bacterium]